MPSPDAHTSDILELTESDFRAIMSRYRLPVYWHIRRLVVTHDDAEDATQETFIRLFRSRGSYRGDCPLTAWIYRLATHEALRVLGRRNRREVSLDDEESAVRSIPADDYTDYSDLEAVRLQRAILSLPPKQQLVFNLRYYDEMPYDEVARVADCAPAAAKANYHHAKERVLAYLRTHE